MRLPGHPSQHGHHINPHTCGNGVHRFCSGFSGGYDTYLCGCCCHDEHRGYALTVADKAWIRRMRGEVAS